jgi:hypothetical protein
MGMLALVLQGDLVWAWDRIGYIVLARKSGHGGGGGPVSTPNTSNNTYVVDSQLQLGDASLKSSYLIMQLVLAVLNNRHQRFLLRCGVAEFGREEIRDLEINKKGRGSAFDKRAGQVSAHSLGRTSSEGSKRLKTREKGTAAHRVKGKDEL